MPPLPGDLAEIDSVVPGSKTKQDCSEQLERANSANSQTLIFGAVVCIAADSLVEGNLLLSAGQIRAMADMAVLNPKSQADKEAVSLLYFALFFHFGGPGRPEVYRDRASSDRFFEMLDGWEAAFGPDYDPGWQVAGRPSGSAYSAAIKAAKDRRLQQLRVVAVNYADDEYFALHTQFQELQARVGAFEAGSPEAELADDLQWRMSARAAELATAPAQ